MSLFGSLFTGVSALSAQSQAMGMISNNIANVNTNGFKKGRAVFEDLLYQTLRQPGAQSSQQTQLPSGLQLGTGVRPVATDLPGIYREFPEFTSSTNWLGFNSLRNMTMAVVSTRPDLTMIDGDPWRVGLMEAPEDEAEIQESSRTVSVFRSAPVMDRTELIAEILGYVLTVVESSDSAVPMARAAQMVISRFGETVLATRWAGAGTFRDLLEGRENPGFAISALKPGYIYDPARHQLPSATFSVSEPLERPATPIGGCGACTGLRWGLRKSNITSGLFTVQYLPL